MTHKEIEEYILSMPNSWLDYPFGETAAVYRVGQKGDSDAKMFALINEGSKPLKISLKCDPLLSQKLQQSYESVMPGYHLNKKHWITIICSGQLPIEEIKGLILLSYNLASSDQI